MCISYLKNTFFPGVFKLKIICCYEHFMYTVRLDISHHHDSLETFQKYNKMPLNVTNNMPPRSFNLGA